MLSRPHNYTSDADAIQVYNTMPPKPGGIGPATLVKMAVERGYRRRANGSAFLETVTPEQTKAVPAQIEKYAAPISAELLATTDFPPVEFVWEGFVLKKHVNLLYGDGGVGKTLLTEHIAVAAAAGIPLYGRETKQMPALVVLAEDDYGETKSRITEICSYLDVVLSALPLHLWCLPGSDLHLARLRDDGDIASYGPFIKELRGILTKIGPCLLVLDTISDFAALDEAKRLPVNTLCKGVFGGLCKEYGASVIVTAHPSKSSMADGTHYSGSTAFNNAVRNRLTFEKPDPDNRLRRVLKVAKSNYGDSASLELFQSGRTFVTQDDLRAEVGDPRDIVYEVVAGLLTNGIRVQKATPGTGQKPRDISNAIREKFGITIAPRTVGDHLNALEREGRLEYITSDKNNRERQSGFRLPTWRGGEDA